MFNGISLLRNKGFFQKKDKINRKIVFSPLLVIRLLLVCISSILIKSVQREFLQSDFLNHLLTGFLGYFLAVFISNIPIERLMAISYGESKPLVSNDTTDGRSKNRRIEIEINY